MFEDFSSLRGAGFAAVGFVLSALEIAFLDGL